MRKSRVPGRPRDKICTVAPKICGSSKWRSLHARMRACAHAHTHKHTHIRTHTYTRAQTHTHTRARAHTHTAVITASYSKLTCTHDRWWFQQMLVLYWEVLWWVVLNKWQIQWQICIWQDIQWLTNSIQFCVVSFQDLIRTNSHTSTVNIHIRV